MKKKTEPLLTLPGAQRKDSPSKHQTDEQT